jgi:hypothetical protein
LRNEHDCFLNRISGTIIINKFHYAVHLTHLLTNTGVLGGAVALGSGSEELLRLAVMVADLLLIGVAPGVNMLLTPGPGAQ